MLLLRSVSKKGSHYRTHKDICFYQSKLPFFIHRNVSRIFLCNCVIAVMRMLFFVAAKCNRFIRFT